MPGHNPFKSLRIGGGGILKSISDNNTKRLNKLLGRRSGSSKFTNDDLSYSLITAVKQGKEEIVATLLSAGAEPNCEDEDGKTPLFMLLESGSANPLILKELLKSGADPNWSTPIGLYPLHVAAKRGFQVCVKHLMGHHADINVQDGHGNTPLVYAARENSLSILRDLLYAGAEPNIANNANESPLHLACKGGYVDCVAELLDNSAAPDIRDNKGQTPLMVACKGGCDEIIELLLEFKCEVNVPDRESGRTVLHWAIQTENSTLVKQLLNLGADPNVKDKNWETPFFAALKSGKTDILKTLLAAGCRVTVTDRSFNTALHIAAKDGQKDFIPLLIKAGLNVDLKGAGGLTPLMLSSFGGHVDTVDIILQFDAKTDLTDRNRASAMTYAILAESSDNNIHSIVKMLIRSNCNISESAKLASVVKTFGINLGDGLTLEDRLYSPLEIAFVRGKMAVFMMLLRAGCDITNFKCDEDSTLREYKGVKSDMRNRWQLLRVLNRERQRMKTLKELCRRPVLDAHKTTLADMVVKYNMDDDLEDFLCFGDLEDVCEQYAADDVTSPPSTPSSPQKNGESPFSKFSKFRQTFSGIGSKKSNLSPTSPPTKTTLPQASWDMGDDLKKKKVSGSRFAIVKPQPAGRQSVSTPSTPTAPLRRTGSFTSTSTKPTKLRGRYGNMNPNDMLLSADPRPMSPEQLSEASSTSSSRTSSEKRSPHQSLLLYPSNGHDMMNGRSSGTARSNRPSSATTYKSPQKKAIVRPRSASQNRDGDMDSLLYGGKSQSATNTPKARRKYGPSKSSSRDDINDEDVFRHDYIEPVEDIWSTPKEGVKMNLQDIEKEMLSNLNLSTLTTELNDMTNSYAEPSTSSARSKRHPESIDQYMSSFGNERHNGIRSNGVKPRSRGYSSSSESAASGSQAYRSSTLPRNTSGGQRTPRSSQPSTPQSSQPGTPRSSKKSYGNVQSSGYGQPAKSSGRSSGYGQQGCRVHESSGYGQPARNHVQSSGYGQTTPKTTPKSQRRTFSSASSDYGTRSNASSAPEYHRSPSNSSNFSNMRNTAGYRSLRIPSQTTKMYNEEYGSPESAKFSTGSHDLSFDQMSNASDPFSDTSSLDMSRSKIPVYNRPTAPSPIKPPPDSKLPIKKVTTPDPVERASPFQRSRSVRKW